jgi:hypothetical protein
VVSPPPGSGSHTTPGARPRQPSFLRSPGGRLNLHRLDLGEPAPLISPLAPRRRDRTGSGDQVPVGLMHEPPGASLRRWPGFQVDQIGAAVPAHPAGIRAGQRATPVGRISGAASGAVCPLAAHHGAESCLSGHAVTAIASIAGMMLHCGE